MTHRLILVCLVLLGACAHRSDPPVCDGRQRRPANPYGSVLDIRPGPPASTPPAPAPATTPSNPGGWA